MIQRGWAYADLMGMRPGDFAHWLDVAVSAAKAEADAARAASR